LTGGFTQKILINH